MGLVLTVAVTSTENRKKKHCLGRDSRSAVTSILWANEQNGKVFDMIPFSALGLTLGISRADLQRYRFNCFSSPNNTASHAVMRCHIREKARLGESVIHFHQPAYRLTGGERSRAIRALSLSC